MHKFIKDASVENARIAIRSDSSIWLIANKGVMISFNRNNGWLLAHRIRLCAGDRVRINELDVSLTSLCDHLGVDLEQASAGSPTEDKINGIKMPTPLSVPASVIENARRNPGTGQIESENIK